MLSAKFKPIIVNEIVKLFYAYNLLFSIADSDQFVKVVKTSRPGYVLLSHKTVNAQVNLLHELSSCYHMHPLREFC